ncbi:MULTISPECIES: cation diffusion facilitator family transporter [unclassified Breznakia]|uniref:cation diffusion facilitator family transporter n=1 Tax=unclassified Breznakia TaxID=2623764 RepID=UPI002474B030|nr:MULTISPECIES: cation diffusion facilitator family transporter [unclassified Breznakia]MDH6367438.1 cation diffusion facilitator family transporter [Breznakia sp. PH1-1]MDH6404589.1 cation diffusion facilitator family transporter [Breznakia sp. PF1-11]MDH6412298.1 cation diffusion facilitator family transporter [Breznakia sp. PFB1-11]MDH6414605.1 cation diffusion facilitator family transporter [Breznakia sp. PFB1-14]MDH6416976.1 cation diffusion facilitator family transporter [Breznakia sp. 
MGVLAKLFIKDYKNFKDGKVRSAYGRLASIYGIFWNMILFTSKLTIGLLFHSVSIQADAFNNLSDAGSSILSLISFIFAAQPADKEHPFGHERLEYIFSMIIAFIILFFGMQLVFSSVTDIIHPKNVVVTIPMVVVLIISIVVKIYMYAYNHAYGKRIDSTVMQATAVDSFSDVLGTSVVLIGLLISHVFAIQLDGFLGVIVALFVLKAGWGIVSETFTKLIGEAPSVDFTKKVAAKILSYPGVLGVHEMIVHSYGPDQTFVTIHVEISSKEDMMEAHSTIDDIENDFLVQDNIHLVIHMDPIDIDDPYTNQMRKEMEKVMHDIDPRFSLHDFRVVKTKTHNNFIFDVEVPIDCKMKRQDIIDVIESKIPQGEVPNYGVINVDRAYAPMKDYEVEADEDIKKK